MEPPRPWNSVSVTSCRAQTAARSGSSRVSAERIAAQSRRLIAVIQPAVFDDVQGVSPRQGWIPLELVTAWMTETLNRYQKEILDERFNRLELDQSIVEPMKVERTTKTMLRSSTERKVPVSRPL